MGIEVEQYIRGSAPLTRTRSCFWIHLFLNTFQLFTFSMCLFAFLILGLSFSVDDVKKERFKLKKLKKEFKKDLDYRNRPSVKLSK